MSTYSEIEQKLIDDFYAYLDGGAVDPEQVIQYTKAIETINKSFIEEKDVLEIVAGENISMNDFIFIARENNPDGYTAGRAYKTNSDYTSRSTEAVIIGFAKTSGAAGSVVTMQTTGIYDGLTGLTIGENYWISNTAGVLVKSTSSVVNKVLVGKAISTTALQLYSKQERKLYEHIGFITDENYVKGCMYIPNYSTINKLTSENQCYKIAATLVGATDTESAVASGNISGSIYIANPFATVIKKLLSDSVASTITAVISTTAGYGTSGLASVSYNNAVYFAGPGSTNFGTNTIHKLTSDTSCPTISATLNVSRHEHTGLAISSSAYFAGGSISTSPSNSMSKLISDSSCTAISATLSASRGGIAGANISSSMYIAGGTPCEISGQAGRGVAIPSGVNSIDKLSSESSCAVISATLSQYKFQLTGSSISSTIYYSGGAGAISVGIGLYYLRNEIDKLVSDTSCSTVNCGLSQMRRFIGPNAAVSA
jgi:hypothetical protein